MSERTGTPICPACVDNPLALLDVPGRPWEMCADHNARVSALLAERVGVDWAAPEAAMCTALTAVPSGPEVIEEVRRAFELVQQIEASRVPVFCHPADEKHVQAALNRSEGGWGFRTQPSEFVPPGQVKLLVPDIEEHGL